MKIILAVLITVAALTVAAEEMVQVAKCNDEGVCIISQDMLRKLMNAVVYWHEQAQSCKGA